MIVSRYMSVNSEKCPPKLPGAHVDIFKLLVLSKQNAKEKIFSVDDNENGQIFTFQKLKTDFFGLFA